MTALPPVTWLHSFTVNAVPVAKGRPRAAIIPSPTGPQARIYTPRETEKAESEFIALADPYAPPAPIGGAVALAFLFMLPIPQSKPVWWQRAAAALRLLPRGPLDVDNLAKLGMDAMSRSGRWWGNDAQIAGLSAWKLYGAVPQTRVNVGIVAEVTVAEWKAIEARAAAGQVAQASLFGGDGRG
jgi:Holliday junction resolvase RusA-like endonuclease